MLAIPTVYEGVRLRSRLESMMAFLMAGVGWVWRYEPTSFLLPDGLFYSPDFFVPHLRLWVETRGYSSPNGESQIRQFARWIHEGALDPDGGIRKPTRWIPYRGGGCAPMPAYEVKEVLDFLVIGPSKAVLHEYSGTFGSEESAAILARCNTCGGYFAHGGSGADYCRGCLRGEPSDTWGLGYQLGKIVLDGVSVRDWVNRLPGRMSR